MPAAAKFPPLASRRDNDWINICPTFCLATLNYILASHLIIPAFSCLQCLPASPTACLPACQSACLTPCLEKMSKGLQYSIEFSHSTYLLGNVHDHFQAIVDAETYSRQKNCSEGKMTVKLNCLDLVSFPTHMNPL